jgi:hypothetical protein
VSEDLKERIDLALVRVHELAEYLRDHEDYMPTVVHSALLTALDDVQRCLSTPSLYCDCCSAGNHTTLCRGECGLADECCHPLYHTDWERAEREHIAEVVARTREMYRDDPAMLARIDQVKWREAAS